MEILPDLTRSAQGCLTGAAGKTASTRAREEPGRSSRRRLKAGGWVIAIGAIIIGTAIAGYAERATIGSGLAAFRHASPAWVMAGIGAEIVSMVAFALLQRQMLRAGGAGLTFGSLLAIAYASNAITLAVPVAGSGMAVAYSERRYRAGGADTARATMALAIAGTVSTVAFAVVVAVGAVVSGNPAAAVLGLLTSLITAAVVACLVVVLRSARGRVRLRPVTAFVLRLSQRLVRRPAGDAGTVAAVTLERLGSVDLSLPAIASAFGYALVNWATDVLCLAAAIAAVGAPVPWAALLLVWSAGAAAASFSPTPYGIGIVDVAMIAALHGAGLHSADAVAAVFCYRLITFKFMATLLWLGYRYLYRHLRRVPT